MTRGALALLALLVAAPRGVRADEPGDRSVRSLRFAEEGERILVSGAFTDAFDEELLEQMSSGFVTTVVLRAYVVPRGGVRPVAFTAATYRVVYDLWDDQYLVQINDASGARDARLPTRADALKAVTAIGGYPVAPIGVLPVGQLFYVAFIVEVNPVSQELLAEVRRWLARPQGGQEGTGNSFFGSFVSVFVNPKLPEADRTLRFQSQYFYRTGK